MAPTGVAVGSGETPQAPPATTKISSIPTPIQSNSRATTASSNAASLANSNSNGASKPHQRGLTHIGAASNSTNPTSVGLKSQLKKSDTVRGTSDFPKSASTDKSRIESFLSRNLGNQNSSMHAHGNDTDAIRTSHSYRTKTELLQQKENSGAGGNMPQHTIAAATVGTASLLASNSLSNNHNNVKSQSATPIKQLNEASNASAVQKSDLRPRLVSHIRVFISPFFFSV